MLKLLSLKELVIIKLIWCFAGHQTSFLTSLECHV